jgi:riboflavin kinase/FMN adenylyltransferase
MAQVIERYEDFPSAGGASTAAQDGSGTAVCLGNFDGVHRGHQKILQTCIDVAKRQRLASVVFTFEPHPMKILKPSTAPRLLMTRMERREYLMRMGFDFILEQKFSEEFSKISAQTFMDKILAGRLRAKEIIVGDNFTFGFQAKGNIDLLKSSKTFHVDAVPAVTEGGAPINSSRIRKAVEEGDIESANLLFGHSYFLSGEVIEGKKLGRKLGFPTANLRTSRECLPKNGIYFCRASAQSFKDAPAAVSIGHNPTVEGARSPIKIEAYLLNFSGDLYQKEMKLDFFKRHRDEKKFSDLDELKKSIAEDVSVCASYFKKLL